MRILEKKEIYEAESNNQNNISYYNFIKQCNDKGIISDKKAQEILTEFNKVYNYRKTENDIDKNFTEIFSVQGKDKIANFANMMGADMAGLEHDGATILCTNVEFGINFHVVNPKNEKVEDYVTLVDLISQGLKNPTLFKEIFNKNSTTAEIKEELEETKSSKFKM